MKLLLISDAWDPQTNGVVTTFKNIIEQLSAKGVNVDVIHPGLFTNVPCPFYNEIRLSITTHKLTRMIRQSDADSFHVSVEGPLGVMARRILRKLGKPFTTSLHTLFPEYIHKRVPMIKVKSGYRYLRWFHSASEKVLVTTKSMKSHLAGYDIDNTVVWGRGVDTELFKPGPRQINSVPMLLYVGRVAVEKNIEQFLNTDVVGHKVVVGDGPLRPSLERKYPQVTFVGYKYGKDLVDYYRQADVFVFPSLTDTFGLVMLEAMACGTPVAAYPVNGPIDVVDDGVTGVLHQDLDVAINNALLLDRKHCRDAALMHSWQHCAQIFQDNLVAANAS